MDSIEANGTSSPDVKREIRSRSRSPLKQSPKERHSSSRDSSTTRDRDRQQRGSRSRVGGPGADDRRRSRAPSNRRVYVANIAYDCKWTDIKDLFRDKVGDVSYVELFEDESGKFRGCGIVELKETPSVQKAIEILHRYEFKGRHLVVKEDFDVERDKTGRPLPKSGSGRPDRDRGSMGDHFGMGGSVGPQYNTYGLSPQFLEALGISGPLSNKVFVANLDYKVTSKKLQEIFRMAGKVLSVELKTDKDGNSKGHGTIEFDHPVEAVQAISMFNGQKLYNRSMSVRMDKFVEENEGLPSKLPSGLQGIGKGLGAAGQPIQWSIASKFDNQTNLPKCIAPVHPELLCSTISDVSMNSMNNNMGNVGVGMGSGNMGMMTSNAMGMGGVSGMGMGMGGGVSGDRGLMGSGMAGGLAGNMGSGLGLGGGVAGLGVTSNTGTGLGLGMTGNTNLMGGGLGTGMGGTGSLTSAMGLGMGGNLGGGTGMGLSSNVGGGGNTGLGGGYSDMDRGFDRGGADSYRNTRSSDTVIVRNIPLSYSWQTLRDRFRDVADVRHTEMKGRGTALIRFNSERDAQRAVDLMHGIRIDGRPIEVNLY